MAAGTVWYLPGVFGKAWQKASKAEMKGSNAAYAVTAAGALVQAWVLVHFVRYAGATTFWKGLWAGFWLWLAFIGIVMLSTVFFEGRPWAVWRINAGYWLLILLINGGLLAAWR
jgi:hypothetical protein